MKSLGNLSLIAVLISILLSLTVPICNLQAQTDPSAPHTEVTTPSEPSANQGASLKSSSGNSDPVPGSVDPASSMKAVQMLVGLTVGFVVISIGLLIYLSWHVREIFWKVAGQHGPEAWRTYLMQLPLGVPDGSVRALVSIFVIIFGLLVLVMQKQLNLPNVEAISGFIGIVITFYFISRGGEQAQKAVEAVKDASTQASAAVKQAAAETGGAFANARSELQSVTRKLADQTGQAMSPVMGAGLPQASDSTAPVAPTSGQSELRQIRERLASVRQVASVAAALGVGTEILGDADKVMQTADGLLAAINPLLEGTPNAASVASMIDTAREALGPLENAGQPAYSPTPLRL